MVWTVLARTVLLPSQATVVQPQASYAAASTGDGPAAAAQPTSQAAARLAAAPTVVSAEPLLAGGASRVRATVVPVVVPAPASAGTAEAQGTTVVAPAETPARETAGVQPRRSAFAALRATWESSSSRRVAPTSRQGPPTTAVGAVPPWWPAGWEPRAHSIGSSSGRSRSPDRLLPG